MTISRKEAMAARLRAHGIQPTRQRLAIAAVLLARRQHLSADVIHAQVGPGVSRATVYNALNLFVRRGLIREIIADPQRSFYDSHAAPHHHFYDPDSGELTDIDGSDVTVTGLPALPAGKTLDGVDVIVRVRRAG